MTGISSIPSADGADFASLQGAELTGVFVWKYGVTLSFNNQPLTITVESNAEFQAQGRAEVYKQEVIVAFGARMLSLVGCNVVGVAVEDDKTLTLSFSEGSKVTLRPDETGYESYSVNLPDGSIFIG
jgi:hypothetical protein